MYKKIILIIISGLLVAGLSRAESEKGGYAGAFLKLAVAPRPAGMGGAYIGVSNDAVGQLYNPAGITAITEKTFSSSYRAMKLDRQLGFVTIIIPTRLQSTLGVSWLYAGYGSVTARNRSGQDLGVSISSEEHDFAVSFAKQFTPLLGIGTKLNYYHKSLHDINANSVGINIGMMFSLDSLFEYGSMESRTINDIKIGLVLDNLSASYSWSTEGSGLRAAPDDDFPLSAAVGISFRALERQLLVAFDVEKNEKQDFFVRLGGEYLVERMFALRAGFDDGVITAGAGFDFDIGKTRLGVDYAFSAQRTDEGGDHIFGLRFIF